MHQEAVGLVCWVLVLFSGLSVTAQTDTTRIQVRLDSLYIMPYNEQTLAEAAELETIIGQTDDPRLLNQILNWYGVYYTRNDEFDRALQSLRRAQEAAVRLNDRTKLASTRLNIGLLQFRMGDLEQAEETYREVEEIRRQTGDSLRLAQVQINLALIYLRTDRREKALQNLLSARKIALAKEDFITVTGTDQNLGALYAQMGRPDLALPYMEDVLRSGIENRDTFHFGSYYGNIAYAYQQLGQFERALVYYDSSLYYSRLKQRDAVTYVTHLDMSEGYAAEGDHRNALEQYRAYHDLYVRVADEQSRNHLAELEVRFDTERKEQELAASRREVQVLEQEVWIRQQRMWIIGAGFSLAFLLAWSINQRWRSRARQRETQAKLVAAELENQKLAATLLENKLANKEADLTNFALDISRKNQFSTDLLERLEQLQQLPTDEVRSALTELIRFATTHLQLNQDLKLLHQNVDRINEEFYQKLDTRFEGLTVHDKYLAGLLRLNLSNKDIAAVKGISVSSAKMARYRLRKKLMLAPEKDVVAFLRDM